MTTVTHILAGDASAGGYRRDPILHFRPINSTTCLNPSAVLSRSNGRPNYPRRESASCEPFFRPRRESQLEQILPPIPVLGARYPWFFGDSSLYYRARGSTPSRCRTKKSFRRRSPYAPSWPWSALGITNRSKSLVGFDERVHHLHRAGGVDVVVGLADDQQQRPREGFWRW